MCLGKEAKPTAVQESGTAAGGLVSTANMTRENQLPDREAFKELIPLYGLQVQWKTQNQS